MYNRDFKLSQSALKCFEDPNICLEEFKGRFVTKTIPFVSSLKMDYGSYFEYLCIGKNSGYEDDVTDLPRKKDGSKKIDQIRIESQSEAFKRMFSFGGENYCWLDIISCQVSIEYENQRGIADIHCRDIFDNRDFLVDLKLTSDVNATHHPAMFGHNENIDITQGVHYCELWEKINGIRPIFSYFVFDYKLNSNFKRIDVEVSDEDIKLLNERKKLMMDFIYSHDPDEDWSNYNDNFFKNKITLH